MFESFWNRKRPLEDGLAVDPTAKVEYTTDGVRYSLPEVSAVEWLALPMAHGSASDLGARLSSLYGEGIGQRDESAYLLPWTSVYEVVGDEGFSGFREPLQIPPDTTIRPKLASKGAMSDAEFSIHVSAWVDSQGHDLRGEPKISGAVAEISGQKGLLKRDVWELLQELRRFHARPAAERNQGSNELAWARMRRNAVSVSAPMGDFLEKTVILTPDKLVVTPRKSGDGEFKTVEIIPGFMDAPDRWLETFDRMHEVQDTYSVVHGSSMTRIIVTPAVKQVLQEIKRMPGRRVAGPRAEAFVRNPFAVLGEQSHEVIDAQQFEEAREAAGLVFEQFLPRMRRKSDGSIEGVSLDIQALRQGDVSSETYDFESADGFSRFVAELGRRIDQGSQCCFWEGYELEILGDTPGQLEQMHTWLREWQTGSLWSANEVLDLSNYSDRIAAIGDEKPYALPFIVRKEGADGWFPENVLLGYQFTPAGASEPTLVPVPLDQVPALLATVKAAKETGAETVQLPGTNQPLPLVDAERIAATFSQVSGDLKDGSFRDNKKGEEDETNEPDKPRAAPRKHLLIKSNIDELDYSESRADALAVPADLPPLLPQSFRSGVALREHQLRGLAWLQHLYRLSPAQCRGAVLADDMGLGKTIQLLSFISERLEADTHLDPVLIVAPVSLLENWKDEIEKFFEPGVMRVLTLYGEELRRFRIPRQELDKELTEQGITRLLRKDWLGEANVVLTTYDTLRDLEFALARQRWSIMVCDEAQRIKNPNALVTRAAKKQMVQFRIACTGTPVENTLMDLWCLFDFIQPGLLGSLQHFGRTYRRPIEAETDEQKARVAELRALIEPQVLRRTKKDVAKDLPAKIEDHACKTLPMSELQLGLYGKALSVLREQREADPSAQLKTLHTMRRICSDPHAALTQGTEPVPARKLMDESPKMNWLVDRLRQLAAQPTGEKVIIFCEFRDLQITLKRLVFEHFKIDAEIINGNTQADPRHHRSRQRIIRKFQESTGFNVIILSPQAVGFGVNIQAANHVIHFMRTWNPAKEDQATDRAYRIGQTRDVTVYTPTVVAREFKTFDQKLDQLLSWKRGLADDMLNGSGDLSMADFAEIDK